jgi:predicted nucleotidyltransferase
MTTPYTNDVFAREVVMARVGHLIRRKQREIERITRILRGLFDPSQVQAPEPGRIKRIILIGPYARRSWYEDSRTIEFSDYEFWVVVNHPLFTDERCWQRARATVDRELRNRCAVDVEVHSKSDIRTAKAERDTFVLDRIEAGITLFRNSRDAPLPPRSHREDRS